MSDHDRAVDDFLQRAVAADRPSPAEAESALAVARARFMDRLADRRRGWQDGHRRIPDFGSLAERASDATRTVTPYQAQLISAAMHQIAEEYLRFQQYTQDLQRQLNRLHADLAYAQQAVDLAHDEVAAASADLTVDEVLPRTPQEVLPADASVLRRRREVMRERRIAEISDRIDRQFLIAQARTRRIADYLMLRLATYWEAVVKSHPEGRQIALLPVSSPSLPAWMDGTCRGGVLTLPTEATPRDLDGP
jgi:hypothetical protein